MTDREFAFNFLPTILVLENGKIKNNIGFLAKKDIEEALAMQKDIPEYEYRISKLLAL